MNQPLSRGKRTVALYLRQTDKTGRMRFKSMQGSSPQSPSVRGPKVKNSSLAMAPPRLGSRFFLGARVRVLLTVVGVVPIEG
ncbi:hypothetical protein IscW_ISCW006945 [Ixodes scapularis]|uniref:Uncharacterized protein n=1 Tax=Ixodes scapularis TaxID=6945 RepID=B7PW75_IXOSC|nr:hypothetical protein IscW_ISCW006945 [Ixodes scapularis]|eukprot:XP_002409393.1 hypothetical protein IscW_ISCW006945 [Ixodes scapularis]